MRRSILVALPFLALAACVEPIDLPPLFTCDAPIFPGEACVDADHPVDFHDDQLLVARSGAQRIEVLTLEGLDVELVSDSPAVVTVTTDAGGAFTVRGLTTGLGVIVARGADGRSLATLPVEVAPITAIELRFDPAGGAPLTELAALPGATERIRVVPLDGRRRELAGAAPLVELSATGPLALADLAQAERRAGSISLFDQPHRPGFEAALRFDALGSGALIARAGAVETTLPIEIIPAASEAHLVLAAPSTVVDWFQLVNVVGTDARGVPVAGLIGDFAARPAGRVQLDDPRAGEAVLIAREPGLVTVTATLPDRTIETSFEIEAR